MYHFPMYYLEVLETLFIKNIVCVMVCPDVKVFVMVIYSATFSFSLLQTNVFSLGFSQILKILQEEIHARNIMELKAKPVV